MTTVINFATNSLGDNIAYSPYPSEYQKIYGGKVYVATIWKDIFKSNNENVEFIDKNFVPKSDKYYNIDFIFKDCPIQKLICDQLSIDYKEIVPSINMNNNHIKSKKKYVCISVQSTSQCKYWNKPNGWNKVVRYLNRLGYEVHCIDKDKVFGIKDHWNDIPDGCIDKTGNHSINDRINQINNCEFFIGLSSGLSWLAWALKKKVVMISGCTLPNNEFVSNNYRVYKSDVCNGCLNDSLIDNKKGILQGWLYCPRNKNFECSTKIDFDDVKKKIDQCINDLKTCS